RDQGKPKRHAMTVNAVFDLPAEVEYAQRPATRLSVTVCVPTNATPLRLIAPWPSSRTTAPSAGALSTTVILYRPDLSLVTGLPPIASVSLPAALSVPTSVPRSDAPLVEDEDDEPPAVDELLDDELDDEEPPDVEEPDELAVPIVSNTPNMKSKCVSHWKRYSAPGCNVTVHVGLAEPPTLVAWSTPG